jgi:putative peptide zinc metalloprotease protein
MATLADSLVSTSSRKLKLRKRGDLSVQVQHHQGKRFYVVKDPVGLGYFRLREEEHFVLDRLDGETSLDDIKTAFEREFAPQQLTLRQLQFFIGQLHRNGLIISHVEGQGEQLFKRRDEKLRRELMGKFSNILAIRFKGIDPERLLTWMDKHLYWIYSTWCVALCVTLMACAGLLVIVQFDEFISKLPAFHEFFAAENAVWLAVALIVTKIFHEFGHGLTCKHLGGECHEIGVMFLVLTPCLYCNVSDSWMLPNKWHRIYIGFGGMYVELVIASICTFIWWFTEPGFLNYIALSTMFVSGVSTVLFNGNPLLRYDGYYILSDFMEIPNLWQKSRTVLNRTLGTWLLGLKFPPDPFLPEKNWFWFIAYAVASNVYRWFVLAMILWFLHKVFEPYGLQIIGQLIALTSIVGLIVMPLYQLIKFFWVPGRLGQVKPIRATVSFAIICALIAAIFWMPLPRRVFTALVVEPTKPLAATVVADDETPEIDGVTQAMLVFVTVPGELTEIHVRPGQRVKKGDVLIKLNDPDLDLEIQDLESRRDAQTLHIENLENLRRGGMPEVAVQIPQAEKTRQTLIEQLAQRQKDREDLTIRAPADGMILPAKEKKAPPPRPGTRELSTWSGTVLDKSNLGAFVETGTMVCQVGDPQNLEAVLIIEQGNIEFVQKDQPVKIKFDMLPNVTFTGSIAEIAESELQVAPEAVSSKAGGQLQTRTDRQGGYETPMETSYQARVPLNSAEFPTEIILGVRGEAKIECGWTNLAQMIYRYVRETFNFS